MPVDFAIAAIVAAGSWPTIRIGGTVCRQLQGVGSWGEHCVPTAADSEFGYVLSLHHIPHTHLVLLDLPAHTINIAFILDLCANDVRLQLERHRAVVLCMYTINTLSCNVYIYNCKE